VQLESAGTEPLFSGSGGLQPDVKAVLNDFKDVFLTEIHILVTNFGAYHPNVALQTVHA
jgi:hypothetical protein